MKLTARMVMVSYALLLFRPVMPVLVDNVQHSFNAVEHFRLVHTHNGREHVHYELSKMAREGDHNKSDLRHKTIGEENYHLAIFPSFERPDCEPLSAVRPQSYYQLAYYSAEQLRESPPPKQA